MEAIVNKNSMVVNHSSSSRFWLLARKMLIENKKNLLIVVGGFLGIWAAIGLWSGWADGIPSINTFITYTFVAAIACTVAASMMFTDLGRKEGRISLLMTPASQASTFWLRLILALPMTWIVAIAGYFIFTGCLVLGNGLSNGVWMPIFNPFSLLSHGQLVDWLLLFSMFLLNESIFVFGAAAWPRKSFLKTVLLCAAVLMGMSFILVAIANVADGSVTINDDSGLEWAFAITFYVISAALIVGSYLKFKRVTVI